MTKVGRFLRNSVHVLDKWNAEKTNRLMKDVVWLVVMHWCDCWTLKKKEEGHIRM